ncbi:MAG TPA: immunoglobulin domain-containing protein [Verrucomicrobiae bacterium]|nr:immunoglobulin domain-containing protein [Verrucomicrobiae bacterium]
MRTWIAVVVGSFLLHSAQAQLLVEHFNYNNGSLGASGIGDTVWNGGDSPSVALIVTNAAALTNASLAGITGKGLQYNGGTFKKRNATFTAQTTGTVYVSFLLSIQTAPSTVKAFVYLHNSTSATGSPELGIFLNGNNIGIGKGVSTPATSTALSAGTHFIVASYTFQSGADQVALWADPTSLGDNSSVPSPTISTTAGSDGSSLSVIFLNHAAAQTLYVDELRVGTSWADVTPTSAPPPPPPSTGLVITNVAMTANGFVIMGTNGPANGQYDVLASSDLTQSISNWPVIATEPFDANGNFSFTDGSATPDQMQNFYVLHVTTNAAPAVPPTISTQPQDTTNLLGNAASFTVGANGTAPLSFQWYFNSTNAIANAASATLMLTNIQYSDAGGYSVIVSNTAGSVTSVVAMLVVTNIETPPFITAQPQPQTANPGQTVTFSVTAGGSVPLFYQWVLNDVTPLDSQTNALLTLSDVGTLDAGNYSVIVSNVFGVTNSVDASLTINTNVVPNFGPVGFCNDTTTITGGAAGPAVYVGSMAELQTYSQANAAYTIYVTNSFALTGMDTHIYSNKTVIGVGNVVLSGGGLYIYRMHNIIVRNLTISGSSDDGIGIHYSDHVWIDHCTLIDSSDGQIDITQSSDYITLSWCKFYYTYDHGHDLCNLIASSDSDNGSQYHTTFHHNWWGQLVVERMPSVRFGHVHCFDNFYDASINGVVTNNYCVRTRIDAQLLVENNWFQNVRDPWEQYITGASGTQGLLFATNNNVGFLDTSHNVSWSGTKTNKDGTIDVMIPGTDTVFTPPYSYTLDNASDVPNIVTNYAGAGVVSFGP